MFPGVCGKCCISDKSRQRIPIPCLFRSPFQPFSRSRKLFRLVYLQTICLFAYGFCLIKHAKHSRPHKYAHRHVSRTLTFETLSNAFFGENFGSARSAVFSHLSFVWYFSLNKKSTENEENKMKLSRFWTTGKPGSIWLRLSWRRKNFSQVYLLKGKKNLRGKISMSLFLLLWILWKIRNSNSWDTTEPHRLFNQIETT